MLIMIGDNPIKGEPPKGVRAFQLTLRLIGILGDDLMGITRRAFAAVGATAASGGEADGAAILDHIQGDMGEADIMEAVMGALGRPDMEPWVADVLDGWDGLDALGAWDVGEAVVRVAQAMGAFTPPAFFGRMQKGR